MAFGRLFDRRRVSDLARAPEESCVERGKENVATHLPVCAVLGKSPASANSKDIPQESKALPALRIARLLATPVVTVTSIPLSR